MNASTSRARLQTWMLAFLLALSIGALLVHDRPWARAGAAGETVDPLTQLAGRLIDHPRLAKILVLGASHGASPQSSCLFMEYLPDGKTLAVARHIEVDGSTLFIEAKTLRFDRVDGWPSSLLRQKQISVFTRATGGGESQPPKVPATTRASTAPTTAPDAAQPTLLALPAQVPSFYLGALPTTPEEAAFWEHAWNAVESGQGQSMGATVLRGLIRLDLNSAATDSVPAALYDVWLHPNGSLTAAREAISPQDADMLARLVTP